MAVKAFLMQNLSPIALLVLEIRRHKNSHGRRERSHQIGLFIPGKRIQLSINEFFMSKIFLRNPKLTLMLISAISKQRKFFSFCKLFGCLDEKRTAATLLTDQFC